MGWLDKLLGRADASGLPAAAAPAVLEKRISRGVRQTGRRSLQAGMTDRLTASWTVVDQTVNMSLLKTLRAARARSRDFVLNNEYGRKFIALVRANIVGSAGVVLKVDCRRDDGTPDKPDSDKVLRAFTRWAKRGQCDVTGKLSWVALQKLIITMAARDGEVLVRKIEGRDRGIHRFQLQIIPGHVLPEDLNRTLSNGNRIRMGVELDGDNRPVAYWIRIESGNADMYGANGQRFARIPANEIYHLFVPEDAGQWRGYPWAATSLRGARHLDQFEEAALIAANVGAAKAVFYQQNDPDAGPLTAPPSEGEIDSAEDIGEFVESVEPGMSSVIPMGYELKEYNPAYPNEVFEPFVKAVLRKQATGLLTSYHSLSGDLTQVSFSSIRQGTLDDREQWKILQGWLIEDFLEPLFADWLARALMFDSELRTLPAAKFDKFNAPVFQGRRWDWVDPKSDIAANQGAVELGVKSRAQIIRENGGDPEQVWAELDAEKARGFTITKAPAAAPAAPPETE